MMFQPSALLVNNDTINAMYLKIILEKNGWLTKKVSCKNAVIEQVMSGKYQVVVVGGNLLPEHGLDLVGSIRALEKPVCSIPIIYLGTSLPEHSKMLLREYKVYTCLSAPVDVDAVMQLLGNLKKDGPEALRGVEGA